MSDPHQLATLFGRSAWVSGIALAVLIGFCGLSRWGIAR